MSQQLGELIDTNNVKSDKGQNAKNTNLVNLTAEVCNVAMFGCG